MQQQPLEVSRRADGTVSTTNPEDMFRIIHAQAGVAVEFLPPEYLKHPVVGCLQVGSPLSSSAAACSGVI